MKKSFAEAWQDYKLLLGVALLYALLASAQVLMLKASLWGIFTWVVACVAGVSLLAGAFLLTAAAFVFLFQLFCMRPGRGGWKNELRAAALRFRAQVVRYMKGPMFANGCFGLLIGLSSFFFTFQKGTVRFVHPYWGDVLFTKMDLAIHGDYPYLMLRELSSGLEFSQFLWFFYFSWFFVMYFVLGCCLFFDPDRQRRMTFIWVFGLCWYYLGGLGATILSCGGPMFFHDVNPSIPDPYAPLQAAIDAQQADLHSVVAVRKLMVDWLNSVSVIVPNAPAAMPSLHSAISVLMFIYLASIDAVLGAIGVIFFILIAMSCVYFGFHYAIDVYFSLLAVPLMWWMVRRHVAFRTRAASSAGNINAVPVKS